MKYRKKMKNNNFVIFIISNGRAENVETLKALKDLDCQYTIYIVCDDLDKQLKLYKEKFANNLIVFSKEEYYKKTDIMINNKELSSPVYARNFCYEIAKEMHLEYFGVFDDDIKSFGLRIEKKGKLLNKKIKKITPVIDLMLTFLKNKQITSLCFANDGFYFGGVNGSRYKEKLPIGLYQAMLLKTNKKIDFFGYVNEDINAVMVYGMQGNLMFMNMLTMFITYQRGTNSGGNKDMYDKIGDYEKAFYCIIARPTQNKIVITRDDIKLRSKTSNAFPKILSEVYKK